MDTDLMGLRGVRRLIFLAIRSASGRWLDHASAESVPRVAAALRRRLKRLDASSCVLAHG